MKKGEIKRIADALVNYSASDIAALCKEAAMIPIRELGARISHVSARELRPVNLYDIEQALGTIRPSVNQS